MTQIRRLRCWLILAGVSLFEKCFQMILFWRLKVLVWQFWLKMQYGKLENLQYLILAKAQWSTLFVCDKWCSSHFWSISLLAYEIYQKPFGLIVWYYSGLNLRLLGLRSLDQWDLMWIPLEEVNEKYLINM